MLSETPCSICGFLLNIEAEDKHKQRWYDFIVECEYLLLRNIYSDTDLQNMKIDSIEKKYEIFDRLVGLFPTVESALKCGDIPKFQDFVQVELDHVFSTTGEIRWDWQYFSHKKRFCKTDFADKIISFTYSSLIKFGTANKV